MFSADGICLSSCQRCTAVAYYMWLFEAPFTQPAAQLQVQRSARGCVLWQGILIEGVCMDCRRIGRCIGRGGEVWATPLAQYWSLFGPCGMGGCLPVASDAAVGCVLAGSHNCPATYRRSSSAAA